MHFYFMWTLIEQFWSWWTLSSNKSQHRNWLRRRKFSYCLCQDSNPLTFKITSPVVYHWTVAASHFIIFAVAEVFLMPVFMMWLLEQLQEREVYSQRQMLLSEIESIRQREAELKREAEVNKRWGAWLVWIISRLPYLKIHLPAECKSERSQSTCQDRSSLLVIELLAILLFLQCPHLYFCEIDGLLSFLVLIQKSWFEGTCWHALPYPLLNPWQHIFAFLVWNLKCLGCLLSSQGETADRGTQQGQRRWAEAPRDGDTQQGDAVWTAAAERDGSVSGAPDSPAWGDCCFRHDSPAWGENCFKHDIPA